MVCIFFMVWKVFQFVGGKRVGEIKFGFWYIYFDLRLFFSKFFMKVAIWEDVIVFSDVQGYGVGQRSGVCFVDI